MRTPPDIATLHELLRFDAATGILYWRERDARWFKSTKRRPAAAVAVTWNKRYADREALGHINVRGYKGGAVLSFSTLAHRVIWAMLYGAWPETDIDHESGCRTDNRKDNLRLATPTINGQNCQISSRNKSGITGVRWNPQMKRWHAQIQHGGKNRHLGLFDTIEEAAAARATASQCLGYHPNHGRPAIQHGNRSI